MKVKLNGWVVIDSENKLIMYDSGLECRKFARKANNHPNEWKNTPYSVHYIDDKEIEI